jgi:hypothetical protein
MYSPHQVLAGPAFPPEIQGEWIQKNIPPPFENNDIKIIVDRYDLKFFPTEFEFTYIIEAKKSEGAVCMTIIKWRYELLEIEDGSDYLAAFKSGKEHAYCTDDYNEPDELTEGERPDILFSVRVIGSNEIRYTNGGESMIFVRK